MTEDAEVPVPPEQRPNEPFNPLAMRHLAESVGNALLTAPAVRADLAQPFSGAGVYAIYYAGADAPYGLLGHENADIVRAHLAEAIAALYGGGVQTGALSD